MEIAGDSPSSSDDNELVARQIYVKIFKVMFARAADTDRVGHFRLEIRDLGSKYLAVI